MKMIRGKKYIILLILFVLSGFGLWGYRKILNKNKYNVIIISIDTLRADHLGLYGYEKNTSPTIDRFAKEAFVFKNAYTTVPCTTPSFQSLMTAVNPYKSNLRFCGKPLPQDIGPTLAEILKSNGYNTAAFVSNLLISPKLSGLDRGFNRYELIDYNKWRISNIDPSRLRQGEDITNAAVNWLTSNNKSSFFLWVHYNDLHTPYTPPDDYIRKLSPERIPPKPTEEFYQKILDTKSPEFKLILADQKLLYDSEIAYVDNQIKILLDRINQLNLENNTIVIIHSDHGEGFDHEIYFGHVLGIYNSVLHVPLIIKVPKTMQFSKIDNPINLIDIYPTLLDLIGIAKPSKIDGQSLIPLLNDDKPKTGKNLFMVTGVFYLRSITIKTNIPRLNWQEKYAVLFYPWKLIYAVSIQGRLEGREYELYDIKNDPTEEYELKDKFPDIYKRLKSQLILEIQKSNISNNNDYVKVDENDEIMEKLKGLGY